MAINLSKEQINEHKESVVFSDEDFVNVNLNNIKENKRIFIPYDELPDSEEMRYSYLESLVSFIERRTGKHCSYFLVNETEPYEVSGFYIQTAPELKDRNGIYVSNNDFIYDKNGVKWHVTYYYKNNQPCILIDNDISGYVVVSNLSEFFLNLDDGISENTEEIDEKYMIEIKTEEHQSFSIGIIILGLLFAILVIIGAVIILIHLSDGLGEMLSNTVKETAPTQSDSESSFIDVFRTAWREVMPVFRRILPIYISIMLIEVGIRIIKRR